MKMPKKFYYENAKKNLYEKETAMGGIEPKPFNRKSDRQSFKFRGTVFKS